MIAVRPYSNLQHSGSDWLGKIPPHWQSKKLKHVARFSNSNVDKHAKEDERLVRLCNYVDVYYNDKIHSGLSFMKATANPNEICRFSLFPGDIIITKDSEDLHDIGIPALVEEKVPDLICGYHLTLIRARKGIAPEYLFRVIQADNSAKQFSIRASGVTRYGLGQDAIGSLILAIPPFAEQRAIATFLDYETTHIDRLIEKQHRLIKLLQEKRQAVISNAIRPKLDGVPTKLRHYVDLLSGYAFPSSGFSYDPDDIPLLRGVNVGTGMLRWNEVVYWPATLAAGLSNYALKQGDIVLGMDRPWISGGTRVAEVKQEDLPALLLQRVARLRPKPGLNKEYLKLILTSREFRETLEMDLTGVSVPHVSPEQILSYRTVLPPELEQREISKAATASSTTLEKACEKAKNFVALLREHRTALISAAVTGKIDVRDWQPSKSATEEEERDDRLLKAAEERVTYG